MASIRRLALAALAALFIILGSTTLLAPAYLPNTMYYGYRYYYSDATLTTQVGYMYTGCGDTRYVVGQATMYYRDEIWECDPWGNQ